jgi:hypothetical protein|tara:strand:+ start:88 stop:564 length:477 start_codon:yes stop_codon:yes gene_type:complete
LKIFDYLRILLVGIGLLQIIGFATGQKWLKGIGQITVASPLPIVFTEQKGCETFALDFSVEYVDSNNQQGTISITPQIYSRFDGPYNYRNVVGAAISYGAILPEKIWKAVLMYAFIEPGEVGRAFNLETPLRKVTVQLNSRTKGKNKVWRLPVENMMP